MKKLEGAFENKPLPADHAHGATMNPGWDHGSTPGIQHRKMTKGRTAVNAKGFEREPLPKTPRC